MNRRILLLLHIASLVLLGFGWTLDLLTIRMSISVAFIGNMDLMDETRSVLGTLRKLWTTHNFYPFILIALFGIAIPIVKTFFIFRVLLLPEKKMTGARLFIDKISKWAMADVFAIGILVSFLAANALGNTTATIRTGFYYFAGYVLLSNCIVMLLPKATPAASE